MITEIPTDDDLREQGLVFLNLAWDTVFNLLLDFADAEDWEAITEDEQPTEYWEAAQRPLATAVALAQQGAEFLLKARIASVSPFLLISARPNEWPRGCDRQNTKYSAFHTADAQDLPRIHDTVTPVRLTEDFSRLFDRFRTTRNTIFHTVDRSMRFSEKEIIHAILRVSQELVGEKRWTELRRSYLEATPASTAWSTDGVGFRLSREMIATIGLIGNADLAIFFGFSKKQRRYICPNCAQECSWVDSDLKPTTAQLLPNSPSSKNVYCFVCRKNIPVDRASCSAPGCKGNVIHTDDDHECLTCFKTHEVDE